MVGADIKLPIFNGNGLEDLEKKLVPLWICVYCTIDLGWEYQGSIDDHEFVRSCAWMVHKILHRTNRICPENTQRYSIASDRWV